MLGSYVKTLSQVCPGGSSAYRQLEVAQILQNRWRACLSFPQRFPLFKLKHKIQRGRAEICYFQPALFWEE